MRMFHMQAGAGQERRGGEGGPTVAGQTPCQEIEQPYREEGEPHIEFAEHKCLPGVQNRRPEVVTMPLEALPGYAAFPQGILD